VASDRIPEIPKTTFWAYDIFGYLLPGLLVLEAFLIGTRQTQVLFSSRGTKLGYANVAGILGAAYLIGHCVAALSSLFLERLLLKHVLGYPTVRMFATPGGTRTRWIFASYRRPYTPGFQQLFEERFEKMFGFRAHGQEPDEHDRFWLAWEYISSHHSAGYRRATHFLELYGFSRNTSFSFLLLCLLPLIRDWHVSYTTSSWVGFSLVASVVLFLNYVKLLRRMNDEVYRAYVVAAETAA
jgi:hypothetical protein